VNHGQDGRSKANTKQSWAGPVPAKMAGYRLTHSHTRTQYPRTMFDPCSRFPQDLWHLREEHACIQNPAHERGPAHALPDVVSPASTHSHPAFTHSHWRARC
jgi:hypothetical protein